MFIFRTSLVNSTKTYINSGTKMLGKILFGFVSLTVLSIVEKQGVRIIYVPVSPSGDPLPFSFGKCCWCGDATILSSHSETGRRAALRCGSFDAFMGRSVWAIKSCPRIVGPWYSSFNFGPWRVSFAVGLYNKLYIGMVWYVLTSYLVSAPSTIDDPEKDGLFSEIASSKEMLCLQNILSKKTPKVVTKNKEILSENKTIAFQSLSLSDCTKEKTRHAGLNSKQIQLNVSNPGVFDDEFKFQISIVGSNPQTDALPPPMVDKVLMIPSFPKSDDRVKESMITDNCGLETENFNETANKNIRKFTKRSGCLSHVLIIPKSMTDFSGVRCDTIGTSLRKWADVNGQFCSSDPGTCMANQLSSLRHADEERLKKGLIPKFFISDYTIPGGFSKLPRIQKQDSRNKFFNVSWNYSKEHITVVEFQLDANNITWIDTTAEGSISDILTQTDCTAWNQENCFIDVTINNKGKKESRYTILIPYCVNKATNEVTNNLKPFGATNVLLEPNTSESIYLSLTSLSPTEGIYTCKIVLEDQNYKRLDHALFDIQFNAAQHKLIIHPDMHKAPTNVTFAGSPDQKMSYTEIMSAVFSSSVGADSNDCLCSLYQIFCISMHFSLCLKKIKHIGYGILSIFVLLFIVIAFGPWFCIGIVRLLQYAVHLSHTIYPLKRRKTIPDISEEVS